MKKKESYVFGPVPSRRLGMSLGVDLVPYKVCSYDCIYCQLGRTTFETCERKAYVPLKNMLDELRTALKHSIEIDFITLSGSGEPTLHTGLAEIISEIKSMTSIPVAVLTNGSLLWNKQVRQELMQADLVIPSLDAGDEAVFQYVNRPCSELKFEKMVDGLLEFSSQYQHSLWLEIFLLGGVTAIPSEVKKIADIVKMIKPDKAQLNTVVRPPAELFAQPVDTEKMYTLAKYFSGNVKVIASHHPNKSGREQKRTRQDLISLLQRRPCTLEDITSGLKMHRNHVIKYITQLLETGEIVQIILNNENYYKINDPKV